MDNDNVTIQFCGDLSLDGLYNDPQHHEGLRENMSWVGKLNPDIDYRVVNWESQLWGDGSVNQLKFPRLCTTKEAAQSVLPLSIDLSLLANNHVYDNQLAGFKNTLAFFDENNIKNIGATDSINEFYKPHIFNKNGVKIAIINYVGLETNPNLPDNCPISLNIIEEDLILNQIAELKKETNHVVVSLHWGDTEYVRSPNPEQRSLAHKIIDQGASMVVGHHVHCLQGYEEYNNGLICYSLGNFLFSPQLVIPGNIDSYRTRDNNMVALLNVNFTQTDFNFSWEYLIKEKNEMFLKLDDGRAKKMHEKTNRYVYYSEAKLNRKYKKELFMNPVRNFIDKNGGFLKATLSIKMKQINLFKKILNI